jgi:hypothetical protein
MRLRTSPTTIADRAAVVQSYSNCTAGQAVDMALELQVEADRRFIERRGINVDAVDDETGMHSSRTHSTVYIYTDTEAE